MSREILLRKLENDEELTAMDSALLEAYLDEEAGSETLEAIKALRREDPSFAWRARLDERLVARAGEARRRSWQAPVAFGSAVAALAAISFIFLKAGQPLESVASSNLTTYLYEWHEEAAAAVLLPSGGTDLNGIVNFSTRPMDDDLDELLYGRSVVESL